MGVSRGRMGLSGSWRRRLCLAGVGFALAAGGLAGCGSSAPASNGLASKSPDQIVKAAAAAMSGSASFHVSAKSSSSGTKGTETLSVDLDVFKNGDLSGQIEENGSVIKLIVNSGKAYFLADPAAWQAVFGLPSSMTASFGSNYVVVPASIADRIALNYSRLVDQITNSGTGKEKSTLSKTAVSSKDGQKVIGVTFTGGQDPGTWYISTTGTPYPVAFANGVTDETVTIDSWNKESAPKAPTDTVVVPSN